MSVAWGQATGTAAPQGGDPGITPNRVIGEVKAIDAAAKQLIVKTDAGALVTATLNDATQFMRVAPGETNLANAANHLCRSGRGRSRDGNG